MEAPKVQLDSAASVRRAEEALAARAAARVREDSTRSASKAGGVVGATLARAADVEVAALAMAMGADESAAGECRGLHEGWAHY